MRKPRRPGDTGPTWIDLGGGTSGSAGPPQLTTFPLGEIILVGTDGAGEMHGSILFLGAASGQGLWFQVGLVDAAVPFYGASLSNGVKGIVP